MTSVNTDALTALGYTVQTTQTPNTVAYLVEGPRNTRYHLCRRVAQPEILFVIAAGARVRSPGLGTIKGHRFFTDKGGVLRPL
jgi:hypothetical protein